MLINKNIVMSLFEKITDDIKKAMLAREKEKLEALRAIKSALLIAKTDGKSGELSQDDELKLLQRLVKQRKDSYEIYSKENRAELAEKELFEANVIKEYLPEQISTEELENVISEIIKETNAQSIKDMGKVMGMASKKLTGRAESKLIADKVKELLNK